MAFVTWMLERLKEPSTYMGIVAMLSAAGIFVDPQLTQNITAAGVGVTGVILFLLKEKK